MDADAAQMTCINCISKVHQEQHQEQHRNQQEVEREQEVEQDGRRLTRPSIYPSIWLAIGTSTNVTLIFFDYMCASEESSRVQELETPGIRASFVPRLTAETKRLH
ncbi:GD18746 [Drosophila simulans]|uniref:GD18746 n=1 Tax=Drosophila simulans TaxID=7240 RepID=B4QU51_DROSI|nr:GD18746 [Drosophila simulans]